MDVLNLPEMIKKRQDTLEMVSRYEFEDIKTHGPVTCHWQLRLGSVGLWVKADVQADLIMPCAQTMEETVVPFETRINEKLAFRRYAGYGDEYAPPREKELKSGDDFFEVIDEDDLLDLKDLVRQYLVMEVTATQAYSSRSSV